MQFRIIPCTLYVLFPWFWYNSFLDEVISGSWVAHRIKKTYQCGVRLKILHTADDIPHFVSFSRIHLSYTWTLLVSPYISSSSPGSTH
jgi:hypothetical protein